MFGPKGTLSGFVQKTQNGYENINGYQINDHINLTVSIEPKNK
jgi:hypothetical protein